MRESQDIIVTSAIDVRQSVVGIEVAVSRLDASVGQQIAQILSLLQLTLERVSDPKSQPLVSPNQPLVSLHSGLNQQGCTNKTRMHSFLQFKTNF